MTKKHDFLLNKDIYFFNNGSYGACPRKVFESYQKWQREIEYQPVEFYQKKLLPELKKSRQIIAEFINAHDNDLILIRNATYAVNTIIRSLDLTVKDEVLITDQEYGACRNAWLFWQQEKGFKLSTIEIALPLPDENTLIKLFESRITSKTKVVFFSHISSFTAQLFPAEKICTLARKHRVLSIVDGAHAIGQITIDMQKINADFYFSNLHKWMFSPKGTAFLYTRPALQKAIKPLITGWGWGRNRELKSGSDYVDSNLFYGTSDLSSFLTIEDSFRFYKDNDIIKKKQQCNALAKHFLQEMSKITGLKPLYEEFPSELMLAVVEVPKKYSAEELKNILLNNYKIEVPVIEWNNKLMIRISVQVYNTKEDVEYFLKTLRLIFNT
ncbi:aminotransferase class V-fold PLP-dependent enzyme [Candidatus Cloacimonadota bacterium]